MSRKIGGIIAAASKKRSFPLLKIGSISVIQRVVISFKQAGVFPIVVVTGSQSSAEIRALLAKEGVIFIENPNGEQPELFESVKLGLSFLRGKAERIVFAPVNIPMFLPATLSKLMNTRGDVVSPVYNGVGGHPIVLENCIIDDLLEYKGGGGLAGAIAGLNLNRVKVITSDGGVIASAHTAEQLKERLFAHNSAILRLNAKLTLECETEFFDDRTKLLLYLLDFSGSVRSACDSMAISYRKAWQLLDELERELGYNVVLRRHGGTGGGKTSLTERGRDFLEKYLELEREIKQYAQNEFYRIFSRT